MGDLFFLLFWKWISECVSENTAFKTLHKNYIPNCEANEPRVKIILII